MLFPVCPHPFDGTSPHHCHMQLFHTFSFPLQTAINQSLVCSNMPHLGLCHFSLWRVLFLKASWLANTTPTLHKTKGFAYFSQLMETSNLQSSITKRGGGGKESAARLLSISLPLLQGLTIHFLFYCPNYNLCGVEEMIEDSS